MEAQYLFFLKNKDDNRKPEDVICSIKRDISNAGFKVTENGYVEIPDSTYRFEYQLDSFETNVIRLSLKCSLTNGKAADLLDRFEDYFIKSQYRKDYYIINSYNENHQYYCCKLMPDFATFDRKLRSIIFLTVTKIFGIDWYELVFSKDLKEELTNRNIRYSFEQSLEILTYEQIRQFLFEPFQVTTLEDLFKDSFTDENLKRIEKEEIINIIHKLKYISLWDRFFSQVDELKTFHDDFNKLGKTRNIVMHQRAFSKKDYLASGKSLKKTIQNLDIALNIIETKTYRNDDRLVICEALKNIKSEDSIDQDSSIATESLKSVASKVSKDIRSITTFGGMARRVSIMNSALNVPFNNKYTQLVQDSINRSNALLGVTRSIGLAKGLQDSCWGVNSVLKPFGKDYSSGVQGKMLRDVNTMAGIGRSILAGTDLFGFSRKLAHDKTRSIAEQLMRYQIDNEDND